MLNMLFRPYFPAVLQSPINCGVVAMLAGLVLVPLVSWLSPKPDAEATEQMFSCYSEEVTVQKKESLGQ